MDVTEHENKIPLGFTTECSKSSIYDYLASLKYVPFYWLNGYDKKKSTVNRIAQQQCLLGLVKTFSPSCSHMGGQMAR